MPKYDIFSQGALYTMWIYLYLFVSWDNIFTIKALYPGQVGENPVEGEDQEHRNELRHQVFKRTQYDRHLMQVNAHAQKITQKSKNLYS